LTREDIEATVDTTCVHCAAPIRIGLDSALRYRVLTDAAEPVISLPLVDLRHIKDPSIVHVF
jgi:hypothetical protein